MDNSYANFQKTRKIQADFNVGGKRVNQAILNFEKVSEESILLCGIVQIKTYLQTASTSACHKNHKDPAEYEKAVDALASKLSGTEIDMAQFASKPDWDFSKGEAKAKKSVEEQLADELKAGKVSKDRAKELQKLLEQAIRG